MQIIGTGWLFDSHMFSYGLKRNILLFIKIMNFWGY